jgi:hypothetical protein
MHKALGLIPVTTEKVKKKKKKRIRLGTPVSISLEPT